MIDNIEQSRLFPITNPRSLAIFGASNNYSSMGTIILKALMAGKYEGTIFPVHPKEDKVQGLTAYRQVADLPEAPDLAVVVLPTKIVCETLAACGEKGIRHVIVISGGFKEVGGDGVARQEEMVRIADQYNMTLIGPNCLGVANTHHRLNTTPHRFYGDPGFIGLVSQSGSFVTQMFAYLHNLGAGFSTAFSIGNEANTDLVDCLEYLGACPNTKVIALYIEGIRRGRKFVETARRIVPHKPIVALYVGGSETGKKAALSHTGALSGPDELYDGIFRQCGVIRAYSIIELFDICIAFGQLPAPGGDRVFVQTHSGGPGAVAADACGRAGIRLPEPSKSTREKLADMIPATGSIKNPIDVTFTKDMPQFLSDLPRAIIQDPACDILMLYFYLPAEMVKRMLLSMGVGRDEMDQKVREIGDSVAGIVKGIIRDTGKPIVCFSYHNREEVAVRSLAASGIPFYQGPERAVRVISAMILHRSFKRKIEEQAAT
ncbi:MAG: CoA-binding protein [Thermodesulfobacteriota bacterium]|nr:CoA-binding protein [Thermodesulfobacteriota bacterium]